MEFYKNGKLIDINILEITINYEDKILKKENEDNIITLDFIKNKCLFQMKEENLEIEIPVIQMIHETDNNKEIFKYKLTSEPEVENIIIIYKK